MTSTPSASLTRASLDQDPEVAYQQVAALLASHRKAVHNLIPIRDLVLRELTGDGHGGIARAARAAGVTHTQAGRLLVEGLARAIRTAARTVGVTADDLTIRARGQAHPARVLVSIPDNEDEAYTSGPDIDPDADPIATEEQAGRERSAWIGRLNVAGALVGALRQAGMVVVADGMAMDVGDQDPCRALADGRRVRVSWTPGT